MPRIETTHGACRSPRGIARALAVRRAGGSETDIARSYADWASQGTQCSGSRYLGSLTRATGDRQYIFALMMETPTGSGELWYVFTVAGNKVVDIQ